MDIPIEIYVFFGCLVGHFLSYTWMKIRLKEIGIGHVLWDRGFDLWRNHQAYWERAPEKGWSRFPFYASVALVIAAAAVILGFIWSRAH
jgi:hypothetical protein